MGNNTHAISDHTLIDLRYIWKWQINNTRPDHVHVHYRKNNINFNKIFKENLRKLQRNSSFIYIRFLFRDLVIYGSLGWKICSFNTQLPAICAQHTMHWCGNQQIVDVLAHLTSPQWHHKTVSINNHWNSIITSGNSFTIQIQFKVPLWTNLLNYTNLEYSTAKVLPVLTYINLHQIIWRLSVC